MLHKQYRQCATMLIIIYLNILQIGSSNAKNNSREQNEVLRGGVRGKDYLGTEESPIKGYIEVNNTASGRTEVKHFKGNTSLSTNHTSSTYKLKQYKRSILKEAAVDENEKQDLLSSKDKPHKEINFEEYKRQDAFKLSSPKEHPYAVFLALFIDADLPPGGCSGTLVTDEWVLTAAHCIVLGKVPVEKILVYAGGNSLAEIMEKRMASGSQAKNSTTFYPHPLFSRNRENTADIGLIKVEPKFTLTETVNVLKYSVDPWPYKDSHKCVFTGFGQVQKNESHPEDLVRKTQVLPVKKPCTCSSALKKLMGSEEEEGSVCSIPKEDYGGCVGDSGSGLICDGKVRAILAGGMSGVDVDNCDKVKLDLPYCGQADVTTRFQEVCSFATWVNGYVQLYENKDIHPDCAKAFDHKSRNEGSNKTKMSFGVTIFLTIGLLYVF